MAAGRGVSPLPPGSMGSLGVVVLGVYEPKKHLPLRGDDG